ncbi:hypothetical protein H0H92_001086, partial [Tricholoma furcatifolium]
GFEDGTDTVDQEAEAVVEPQVTHGNGAVVHVVKTGANLDPDAAAADVDEDGAELDKGDSEDVPYEDWDYVDSEVDEGSIIDLSEDEEVGSAAGNALDDLIVMDELPDTADNGSKDNTCDSYVEIEA